MQTFAQRQGRPGKSAQVARQALRSPGGPLGPAARAHYGLRPGHDFGRVRVQAEGRPSALTKSPIRVARQSVNPPTQAHSDAGYAPPPGGVVSPDVTVTEQRLNKSDAVAYARRYARSGNPEFIARSGGSDCTEFVSQCMFAGGWGMVYTGDFREQRRNDRWFSLRRDNNIFRSFTWAGAQNFSEFVGISGRGAQVSSAMQLDPGDVIQFRARAGGHIHHSMIVTGKTANDLLISQNSIALLDHPFSQVRARNDVREDYVYWRMH